MKVKRDLNKSKTSHGDKKLSLNDDGTESELLSSSSLTNDLNTKLLINDWSKIRFTDGKLTAIPRVCLYLQHLSIRQPLPPSPNQRLVGRQRHSCLLYDFRYSQLSRLWREPPGSTIQRRRRWPSRQQGPPLPLPQMHSRLRQRPDRR